MLCPSCLTTLPGGISSSVVVDAASTCASCGARTALDGRYRLDEIWPGERSFDAVDGVGPLVSGTDLRGGSKVLVRLLPHDAANGADDNRHRARLAREATILGGLRHPQVAGLRATTTANATTTTAAIVLDHPGGSVDAALARGLRVDGTSLRAFLGSLLGVLADLEEKSPPVHLGGLHAGNVAVEAPPGGGADGALRVTLVDFARATDTLVESLDVTTARPGMAPPARAGRLSPCALDLWSVGVLAVQLAARTAPADLPRDADGRPDLARAVRLDAPLTTFLQRLMTHDAGRGRGGFASKREALDALRALPRGARAGSNARTLFRSSAVVVAGAVGGVVAVVGAFAGVAWLMTAAPRPGEGSIIVTTDPADARVTVDGVVLDHDVARVVGAGAHRVDVSKAGWKPFSGSVEVVPGGSAPLPVFVALEALPIEPRIPHIEPHIEPRVDPPKVEPPPKIEPPTTIEPPTKRVDPQVPVVDVDAALLRAIEAAVRQQQAEIEACPDDGSDRIKLHLVLKQQRGTVTPLARGDVDAVVCVADAVSASSWPMTPHQQVDADVWVWRRPSFKVAAY